MVAEAIKSALVPVYELRSFRSRDALGALVGRARKALAREFDRELEALGLNTAQALVIVLLAEGSAGTAADIGRELAHDPGAMTRIVDKLEAAGYVRRVPREHDRRAADLQLDTLVDEALAGSPNMRLAQARLDQARAQARIVRAPLRPQVNADASVNRQRFSENYIFPPPIGGSSYTTTQLDVSASWEADFWGRNRAAYEAALGRTRAAQAEAFAARLALSAGVGSVYVQLARAYDQLDLARRTLEDRERVQTLTTDRVRAGLDSRLELKQVETSIPAARARVAQIEEEISLARSQLAALLGKGPDRGLAIERPQLHMAAVALPSRVPADLLGRRPDSAAARARVEAGSRDIAAAKAAFYPDISLTALIGVQSVTLSKLLETGSAIPSAGAAIRLPIFDSGRLRGNLAARNADYDAAVEQYNQARADALREVVDQLASMRSVQVQRAEAATALAAAAEADTLAVTRYQAR